MTAEGRSIAPSSWLQHPPATCRRDLFEAVASLAVTTKWSRGQEICSEEGEAGYWYRVSAGMARRYAVRPSGRRQIVGAVTHVSDGDYQWLNDCMAVSTGEVRATDGKTELVIDVAELVWEPLEA